MTTTAISILDDIQALLEPVKTVSGASALIADVSAARKSGGLQEAIDVSKRVIDWSKASKQTKQPPKLMNMFANQFGVQRQVANEYEPEAELTDFEIKLLAKHEKDKVPETMKANASLECSFYQSMGGAVPRPGISPDLQVVPTVGLALSSTMFKYLRTNSLIPWSSAKWTSGEILANYVALYLIQEITGTVNWQADPGATIQDVPDALASTIDRNMWQKNGPAKIALEVNDFMRGNDHVESATTRDYSAVVADVVHLLTTSDIISTIDYDTV